MPLPMGLVVKKGSKMRFLTSGGMPGEAGVAAVGGEAIEAIAQSSVLQSSRRAIPLALLGMVGIGLPNSRRRKQKKRQTQGLSDYRSKR